jgi:hypothetical protein
VCISKCITPHNCGQLNGTTAADGVRQAGRRVQRVRDVLPAVPDEAVELRRVLQLRVPLTTMLVGWYYGINRRDGPLWTGEGGGAESIQSSPSAYGFDIWRGNRLRRSIRPAGVRNMAIYPLKRSRSSLPYT